MHNGEDFRCESASSSAQPGLTASSPQTKADAIEACIADIVMADFVAVDLEFSGLFLQSDRDSRPLEVYFAKCRESIPKFLALQLGLCCGRYRPSDGVWELRAHEFNLWPHGQSSKVFCADLTSLLFLHRHGFDFNAYFRTRHKYERLPPRDAEGAEPAGAARVIAALRAVRVPLVVHNGLLDVLHLFDKFVGDLPQSPSIFGEVWVTQFPFTFDTRHMAQEGRHGLRYEGRLELNELHRHLHGLPCASRFERLGPLAPDRPTHGSAGQDATTTAEVFVLTLEVMMREPLTSSTTLRTNRLCRRFHNRVATMGVSDAFSFHLGNPPGILLVPPLIAASALLPLSSPSNAATNVDSAAPLSQQSPAATKDGTAADGAAAANGASATAAQAGSPLLPVGARSPPAPPLSSAPVTAPPELPVPPPPECSPTNGTEGGNKVEELILKDVSNDTWQPTEVLVPKPRWVV